MNLWLYLLLYMVPNYGKQQKISKMRLGKILLSIKQIYITIFCKRIHKADKIRNDTTRSDLSIWSINDKIEENKMKWKYHVDTMVENGLPKKIIYQHIRERDLGRPRKKGLEDRGRNR